MFRRASWFFLLAVSATKIYSQPDWLIENSSYGAKVARSADKSEIVLDNGLVRRAFRISPNAACTDYRNLSNGQQLLRAIKPEAKVIINGIEYAIGGLHGQTENAYLLPSWINQFHADTADFTLDTTMTGELQPFISWKQSTWASNPRQPTGKMLVMEFRSSVPVMHDIVVSVHYELYDGIPLMIKWVSVENKSNHSITVNRVVNEELALVEEESAVVGTPEQMKKQHGIYVETNYAFNNAMRYDISDQTTHWKTDTVYTSHVNYSY